MLSHSHCGIIAEAGNLCHRHQGREVTSHGKAALVTGLLSSTSRNKNTMSFGENSKFFIEVTGLLFPLSIQTMQPAWHSLLGSHAGHKGLLRDAFCGPIQWGFPQGPLLWLHQLASSSAYRRTFRQLQVPHICGPFWLGGYLAEATFW